MPDQLDIHDEYGGKIGEIRKAPFSKDYDIVDGYGGKVGEIRSSPDYGGQAADAGGMGILILVLLIIFLPIGLLYLLFKYPKIGMPILVGGLLTAGIVVGSNKYTDARNERAARAAYSMNATAQIRKQTAVANVRRDTPGLSTLATTLQGGTLSSEQTTCAIAANLLIHNPDAKSHDFVMGVNLTAIVAAVSDTEISFAGSAAVTVPANSDISVTITTSARRRFLVSEGDRTLEDCYGGKLKGITGKSGSIVSWDGSFLEPAVGIAI